jgi:hypothetical protein
MKQDPIGFNPPAVVRTARRSLAECAKSANAAVKKGEAAIIEIGQALLEAKAQLSHTQWLPWLTANFCASHSTATRAMRAVRAAALVVDGEILDAFDTPIDGFPEATVGGSPATPPTKSQTNDVSGLPASANIVYCRPCRTTGVKPDCPQCAKERAEKIGLFPPEPVKSIEAAADSTTEGPEEEATSDVPERVRAALNTVPAFRECVDMVTEVQAAVVRLRESPGGWHVPVETIGDMCRAIEGHIWNNRPEAMCDECNGKGCSVCDSQGWQSATTHKELNGTKP